MSNLSGRNPERQQHKILPQASPVLGTVLVTSGPASVGPRGSQSTLSIIWNLPRARFQELLDFCQPEFSTEVTGLGLIPTSELLPVRGSPGSRNESIFCFLWHLSGFQFFIIINNTNKNLSVFYTFLESVDFQKWNYRVTVDSKEPEKVQVCVIPVVLGYLRTNYLGLSGHF